MNTYDDDGACIPGCPGTHDWDTISAGDVAVGRICTACGTTSANPAATPPQTSPAPQRRRVRHPAVNPWSGPTRKA